VSRILRDLVLEREELAELDDAERRLALRSVLAPHVEDDELGPSVVSIEDEIAGYGILGPLIRTPDVTDVLVNGIDEVWIERSGRLERTEVRFDNRDHLYDLIQRLSASAHMRIDAAAPMADGELPDGSRVNVVLPPVAVRDPVISIRCFPKTRLNLDDLVARKTLEPAQREALEAAVADRQNVLISGATGTGKTTLLNALLNCVPPDERVITIEETRELVARSNLVALATRAPNVEGRGCVDAAALLRNALRMRPDRIVVGEARGAEAWVALSAMATGHRGSLLTVHAGSPGEAVERLRALAALARDSSPTSIEAHLQALEVVVQMTREGARRRVTEVLSL
jgi:pilus assembly protein CpaF